MSSCRSILFIEDDDSLRQFIRKTLSEFDVFHYKIDASEDLQAALSLLQTNSYDLILLDFSSHATLAGPTVTRIHHRAPDVPIVILTGQDDQKLANDMIREGASDYLVKREIGLPSLVRVIENAIARQQHLNSLQNLKEASDGDSRFYKTIFNHHRDGIIVVSEDQTVLFINPAAETMFAGCLQEVIKDYIARENPANETCEFSIVDDEETQMVIEMSASETTWQSVPVRIGCARDITHQAKLRDELHTMALTDELTGLYNRRGFTTLTEQLIKGAQRNHTPLLFLLVDLDDLKQINDTFGHAVGDQAIIQTATILKEAFRESDVVARLGGDEFLVLALDAYEEVAEKLSARIRASVVAFNSRQAAPFFLSLSIGILTYDPDALTPIEDLMARVDQKMYFQKQQKQRHRSLFSST